MNTTDKNADKRMYFFKFFMFTAWNAWWGSICIFHLPKYWMDFDEIVIAGLYHKLLGKYNLVCITLYHEATIRFVLRSKRRLSLKKILYTAFSIDVLESETLIETFFVMIRTSKSRQKEMMSDCTAYL